MYSLKAKQKLSAAGAEAGDKIKITADKRVYEGILMPKTEFSHPDIVVIKLSNGYNIGIYVSEAKTTIKVVEKGKPAKKEKEAKWPRKSKEDIVILGCGGTIASRIEYKTGAVFPSVSGEDLTTSFPEIKEKKIRSRQLFQLLSEDMNTKHWQIIAEETAKEIRDGAKGVILMHGTDIMHYTSAALSFMLKTPVPIVLVGAQRSGDRGSSDNKMNLLSAMMLAESDIAEIGICMHATTNDDFCYFHPATHVRKLHTSRRDAFQTINRNPIAKVHLEENRIEPLTNFKGRNQQKLEVDTKMNGNVALIHTYPGIKPEFIERLDSYDGVVIGVTGIGHVPANSFNDPIAVSVIPAIKDLIAKGIPVVVAPQTIFGRINMNIYANGRKLIEAGVIGNYCDWTPETAYTKLCWVLGHTKDMNKVREMMLTNYAGEINERIDIIQEK